MPSELFNARDAVAQGWYWLMRSGDVARGKVKPARILGYDLAVFRGEDDKVRALDAHCPHMGAHLAEGRVDGNSLRCFFHLWRFDETGQCTDIPCLDARLTGRIKTGAWQVYEAYGLIWLWLGDDHADAMALFPVVPELGTTDVAHLTGGVFTKGCHPNVVMINAIDEQHFRSVHHMPGHILSMQPIIRTSQHIDFENTGKLPARGLGGWLQAFYKKALTYNLSYFYGHVGVVTLGPDFLHMYLMFALRLTEDGKTEGRAIAITRRRRGIAALFNPFILWLTKIVGDYFAVGDTRVFAGIRFDLKNPIAADRAIIAFMEHMEQQPRFPVKDVA